MFTGSGCTFQEDPKREESGPFCESDCSSETTTPPAMGWCQKKKRRFRWGGSQYIKYCADLIG